jgi:sugar phosphate isomerase/epimerase
MTHRYPPDTPLSLAHLSELDQPPVPLLRAAAAAGFASIGLRIAPASPGGIVYPLADAAERAELCRLAAGTGTSVLYVEMINLGPDYDADLARRTLDTGAAIGASRLAVCGESADFGLVAAQLAELCAHAAPFGIAVDIEFMPYRRVATLADAADVVRRSAAANAHVLVDALHMHRSGSTVTQLAALPAAAIGTYQICDAPAAPLPFDELVVEARTRRLLAGTGGIPLRAQIAALPPGTPLGVEVPLAGARPDLDAAARLKLLVAATHHFLQQGAIS